MKRAFYSILSIFMAVFMTLGLFTTKVSAEETKDATKNTIILYTNDVHAAIDGYSTLAGYRQQLIDEGHKVFTVDAGDALQGEVIALMTRGEAIVNLMNLAGYDFAVPGNHEFDYQVPRFIELSEKAEYQYLCANFLDLENNKSYFDAYKVVEVDGHKIGFVGIATPETYTKSTPTYFQNEQGEYIFNFGENDYYPTIQKAIDEAKAAGAEIVIAIGHTGMNGTTEIWNTKSILANTTGIDAYIDGHSHESIDGPDYLGSPMLNKDGKAVTETMTGTKFANIGRMEIDWNTKKITTSLVKTEDAKEAIATDAAKAACDKVQAVIDEYNTEVESYYGAEIGRSETTLYMNDPETGKRLVRNSETNLGDFVSDAYRTVFGTDIALANGGGLRATLNEGIITRQDLVNTNPFGNEMCVIEAKGQTILDALEHSARMYPQELGGFFAISGMTYTLNAHVDTPVILDDQGSFAKIDETKPRRVQDVKINNEPIDPEKIYTVAGSKYILQQAGDGMTMFKDCKAVLMSGLVDNDTVLKYVEEYLNGVIPKEGYDKVHGQGRITILEHEWKETSRVEATVINEGKIVYTCEECGKTKEEVIPKPEYTGFTLTDGTPFAFLNAEEDLFWFEDGIQQGVPGDQKNIWDTQHEKTERGREIYDPKTDAWYWLDAIKNGAVAKDKEVWMPYIFQGEDPATEGKWVRYDKYGEMVKGWYANDNGIYYYDSITGAMYKGTQSVNNKTYHFNEITGIMD